MPESYWEKVSGKNIPSSLELYPIIYNYLREGHKILDIGCGFGKISLELASLGYSVTGIDINAEAIRLAEAAAKNLDPDKKIEGKAEFKFGNASALPFGESSFDIAVMQAFLTTVPNPQERARIIKEALESLNPEDTFTLWNSARTGTSNYIENDTYRTSRLQKKKVLFLPVILKQGKLSLLHTISLKKSLCSCL